MDLLFRFFQQNPQRLSALAGFLSAFGGLATACAVIWGAIFAIRQYGEAQRLKAADILLSMEKEFLTMADICHKLEVLSIYSHTISPILTAISDKGCDHVILTKEQTEIKKELDRLLRFFYICSILHGELHVEQNVIGRAYYYWLGLLVDQEERSELCLYIEEYYKRLNAWLCEHKIYLHNYRESGRWVRTKVPNSPPMSQPPESPAS